MFRFTIRDVLWLTALVALGVSWWIDNKRIENTVAKLEKEGRLQREANEDKLTVLNELEAERRKLLEHQRLRSPPIVIYAPPRRAGPEKKSQPSELSR